MFEDHIGIGMAVLAEEGQDLRNALVNQDAAEVRLRAKLVADIAQALGLGDLHAAALALNDQVDRVGYAGLPDCQRAALALLTSLTEVCRDASDHAPG